MKNLFFRETVSDRPSPGMTASLLIHRFHLQRSGILSDCDQARSLLVFRKLQFHTAIRAPMQMIDGTGAIMSGRRASASHRTHVNKQRIPCHCQGVWDFKNSGLGVFLLTLVSLLKSMMFSSLSWLTRNSRSERSGAAHSHTLLKVSIVFK